MDQRAMIALVIVVAVVAIAAAVLITVRRRRMQQSEHLRAQFGPEYERSVRESGSTAKAEMELLHREKRVHRFTIKPLAGPVRERFAQEWMRIQGLFVDDPSVAVNEADLLVTRVMEARGYPMADFEQRTADISVNYPDVVQHYRAARAIAVRRARGEVGTEDLRQAMVHYRSLFDELLSGREAAATTRGVLHERAS